MRRFLAALVVAVLLGACGSDDSSDSAMTTESDSASVPLHSVPDDAQVVWGTAQCRAIGGLECELDMSDPRVSGIETIDQFRRLARAQWAFDRDVITNADGTWRGSAQGSDNANGDPAGEAHFVGEGAYEGLEFHYYLTEAVFLEGADLRGWISRSTPVDPASSAAPVAPFHPVPAGSVAVSGTAACDSTGSGAVDGQGALDVLVTCQLDLSDPRVSGTERRDRVRILAGRVGAGDVRMVDDARITAADGAWSGTIQAATDDAAVPTLLGEAHYVGEGAHEGLEFHYYFADLDSAEDGEVRVHGWISPATGAPPGILTHVGEVSPRWVSSSIAVPRGVVQLGASPAWSLSLEPIGNSAQPPGRAFASGSDRRCG